MSNETEKPPTLIAFLTPNAPPEPQEKLGLFGTETTLRDVLVTVMRGDYATLDWSVAESLRVLDPGERSPPLMRAAARLYLRRLAGEIALNREKPTPTWRADASYATVAFSPARPDPPRPTPLEPPRKAKVELDASRSGVCSLCGHRHKRAREFGGQCVAVSIIGEHRRRGAREEVREADKEMRAAGFRRGSCAHGRKTAGGPPTPDATMTD